MPNRRHGWQRAMEITTNVDDVRTSSQSAGLVHAAVDGEDQVLWDGPHRHVDVVVAAESSMLAEGLSALLDDGDEISVTVTTGDEDLRNRLAEDGVDVLLLEAALVESRPRVVAELVATAARPRVLLLEDLGVDNRAQAAELAGRLHLLDEQGLGSLLDGAGAVDGA